MKQPQQNRAYLTNSNRSRVASYELKQSTNSKYMDDRRVINSSTSMKITVNNSEINTNENYADYESLPDTRSLISIVFFDLKLYNLLYHNFRISIF